VVGATTVAQESRVLLADEPVASLGPETAEAVLSLLQMLARTKEPCISLTWRSALRTE